MKLKTIRHSLAHILAYAVKLLWPQTKLGIGPPTEFGFYYDFDFPFKFKKENLEKIEKKMRELIKKNLKFKKKIVLKKEAEKLFKNEPYKLNLLKEMKEKKVSIYETNHFFDLCKGPHLKNTSQIPSSFKLWKISGAYWKGDEKNPMLTRIYGISFASQKELNNFLKREKKKEESDHRKLGKRLELFIFSEEIGAGLPLWLPKGETIINIIQNFLREELEKKGYLWVKTPHLGKLKLWKISGHWDFYRENIYSPFEIEDEKYLLKPMNCPFHIKIYQRKIRSYKDLPLKLAEFGTVYRYEKSGVLHGLTRVRGFTQDDAHIFCLPEQLEDELLKLLSEGIKILKTFGFKEFEIFLSTRPEKFMGTFSQWQKAESALKNALKNLKLSYQIDPGEGVFYGPKIDIKIKDNFNRLWQCSTFQIDFNLPQAFSLFYIDQKGKKKQPIMIHRALLGSLERFIGILLEHFRGNLPSWLSPVQVWIIAVGSAQRNYALKLEKEFKEKGIRVEAKIERKTVAKKIREGEILKIPYLLVVGEKEMKNRSVRVRSKNKDLGEIKFKKFLKKILEEIKKKK